MEMMAGYAGREADLIALFRTTFTASEGDEEGALIGGLVTRMLQGPQARELLVFTAQEQGAIIGGILFSPLVYAQDARTVFLLAPVAVAPDWQGRGIGQRLLAHGLAALASAGVDIAMTYGDPNFYAKVGFVPISQEDAPAPFPLQYPEGWLAQSLTGQPLSPLKGPSRCVEALNDPVYW